MSPSASSCAVCGQRSAARPVRQIGFGAAVALSPNQGSSELAGAGPFNFAEKQSRGHHFGALAAAQAGQHDPEVGEVAAREPELVVDVADDIQRGPHRREWSAGAPRTPRATGRAPAGPGRSLAPGRTPVAPSPGPAGRFHAGVAASSSQRPGPASRGASRNTGFSMTILDHATKPGVAPPAPARPTNKTITMVLRKHTGLTHLRARAVCSPERRATDHGPPASRSPTLVSRSNSCPRDRRAGPLGSGTVQRIRGYDLIFSQSKQ